MSDEPSLGFEPPPQKAAPYRVLARKYRPSDFTGLIGQDALVRTLSNAFATGRIAHAFMLTGVRGVGKTTTARIIARALNCIGPDGQRKEPTIQPCGVCEPCVAIAESRHVDVQEMDAASNNGIDEVRQIIDSVRYAPASARYKVYILDEVHMLSKPAFNAILKTLEEPPPHVKFIFATTEIRKVPVTILSRCQRFDLRRIETEELIGLLATIAEKESVKIARDALALIARAAEGSARDSLSLLDQAIAHGEGGEISADAVRDMLGLADRGRVLDLFEKVMAGKIAEALADLGNLYDHGADPLAVMQDLLEIVHFLTRVKVAPGAEGFFDGSSGEARRAADMAARLSVPSLTRAWQILLKGLIEVRDATRPVAACEMALIRLSHAADLPPTDKLVRDLMDGESKTRIPLSPTGGSASDSVRTRSEAEQEGRGEGASPRALSSTNAAPAAKRAPEPTMSAAPAVQLRSLEDIAALAQANGAPVLKVHIENDMHLVHLEQGKIEFRPTARAPRTLAGDLSQKLKDWTGIRWSVSVAREGGAPTLAEQKRDAKAAKFESATQEPMVRAVLDRFQGAEIVAVRTIADEDIAAPMPDDESVMASLNAGPEIERLIQLLAKLPGLGPRSARRAALTLLKKRDLLLEPLALAMREASAAIKTCETCGNLDTTSPCSLCRDPRRETQVLCIVEDVADLWALERAGIFRGKYHVLGGALSALDGVTPERLNVTGLLERVRAGVDEVILAMNATVEGQTTAHYLMDMLAASGVKVTRLAHGVPVGGELDYLDEGTLSAAFKARRSL